jgi:hypothetical protein
MSAVAATLKCDLSSTLAHHFLQHKACPVPSCIAPSEVGRATMSRTIRRGAYRSHGPPHAVQRIARSREPAMRHVLHQSWRAAALCHGGQRPCTVAIVPWGPGWPVTGSTNLSSGSRTGVSAKSSPVVPSSSRTQAALPCATTLIRHVAICFAAGGAHSAAR